MEKYESITNCLTKRFVSDELKKLSKTDLDIIFPKFIMSKVNKDEISLEEKVEVFCHEIVDIILWYVYQDTTSIVNRLLALFGADSIHFQLYPLVGENDKPYLSFIRKLLIAEIEENIVNLVFKVHANCKYHIFTHIFTVTNIPNNRLMNIILTRYENDNSQCLNMVLLNVINHIIICKNFYNPQHIVKIYAFINDVCRTMKNHSHKTKDCVQCTPAMEEVVNIMSFVKLVPGLLKIITKKSIEGKTLNEHFGPAYTPEKFDKLIDFMLTNVDFSLSSKLSFIDSLTIALPEFKSKFKITYDM